MMRRKVLMSTASLPDTSLMIMVRSSVERRICDSGHGRTGVHTNFIDFIDRCIVWSHAHSYCVGH